MKKKTTLEMFFWIIMLSNSLIWFIFSLSAGDMSNLLMWLTWIGTVLNALALYNLPLIMLGTIREDNELEKTSKIYKKFLKTMFMTPFILIYWYILVKKNKKNNEKSEQVE